MKNSTIIFLFLNFYRFIWWLASPILRKNARLREGIKERTSSEHLKKADIWIQGASAGESNLVIELIKNLYFKLPKQILLTSTTSQGVDLLSKAFNNKAIHSSILSKASSNTSINLTMFPFDIPESNISMNLTWFPFDMPNLMESVICKVKPAVVVLLETELWPSLLFSAKKHGVKVVVINGRMSKKSHRNYMLTRWLWNTIQPDTILAISNTDAQRFKDIFPSSKIDIMPNIKFDTIFKDSKNSIADFEKSIADSEKSNINFLLSKIGTLTVNIPFSVLASIRKEEEQDVLFILNKILEQFPNQVVGLFPRHMHRIDFWKKALTASRHNWILRSEAGKSLLRSEARKSLINGTESVSSDTVILWDVFGELKNAYSIATVAFVGGSLKPLGGHNFIEPLTSGVATVTGQFIDDFAWVGETIFTDNIVKKAIDKEGVIDFMVSTLKNPPDRKDIIKQGLDYVEKEQGGTAIACNTIKRYIST